MGAIKWAVGGALVATLAAGLAYIGGPIAHAALAALVVSVLVGLGIRQDRHLKVLRASASKAAKDLDRVSAQNRDLQASIKALSSDTAALAKQLTKTRSALDEKIALAVTRIHDKVKAELRGLATAKQDAEVEAGLDALNRYTALATQMVDPPADNNDTASDSSSA